MFDVQKFVGDLHDYIGKSVGPLLGRLKAVEDRLAAAPAVPEKGDPGTNGKDGASVTLADVEPLIAEQIKAAVGALPAAKDGTNGTDGKDGQDAEPIELKAVLAELMNAPEVKTLLALLVAEAVPEGIAKHLAANPAPAGKDGRDGVDGTNGTNGVKGDAGADGIGLASAMIDRGGELIVTTTKGEGIRLGVVVGKDGDPGKNGSDGVSFESVEPAYDPDAHEVVLRVAVAGQKKEFRYPAGGIRPAGYWRDGTKAKANEAWTNDGSLWIALKDTAERPGYMAKDAWVLAARCGKPGEKGDRGLDFVPTPASIPLKETP